jgi:hypothetical protein
MFWTDVASLNWGSDRQRDAYQALIELDIFSVLAEFDPILTGTYPLGLETEASDLDVVCHVEDFDRLVALVTAAYGNLDEFHIVHREKNGWPTLICRFRFRSFPVEIFAQPRPSEQQNAYRHMQAEAALLRAGGDEARDAIRRLRLAGVKTEPAFAQYFCLVGDPYEMVLEVADMSAGEVADVVLQARYLRRGTGLPVEPVIEQN